VLKAHYQRFLQARPGRLHFAAHSHHLWPDVTRDAVLQAWDDASRLVDRKWDHIFGEVVPKAQRHVARILDVSRPGQIAFAPNTHELVVRLLSCFEEGRPLRVLTTDSEFYSFARQAARLAELPRVSITRVPTEPFGSFDQRFREAAAGAELDLVYLSHVFFNSAFVVADLAGLVASVKSSETMIVIDGYHAFCAIPFSLRAIEDRVFYVGGGYKYAQAGEGLGYLHVPASCRLRPANTGWFASFGALTAKPTGRVEYSDDAFRFWGATYEPVGAYRFNAVMDLWAREGVTPQNVHAHANALQHRFLEGLERRRPRALDAATLVTPRDLVRQGNFLCFRFPEAPRLHEGLRARDVETDLRGDCIRFGFGVYQDAADVDALLERLAGA
jgi:selenocysteine lyase/cysteine desulfurase